MADTPKLERSTPIKPAQATQGFGEVTSQFASFSSNIGQMGATLAQESANKMAQIQGIEDAQRNVKEGKVRPMLPSFTEADKHYAQAYEHEQTQELGFQGQQMLEAFMKTAARTPTGSALGDYEKFGRQGIDELVSKAPRANQAALRRSLEGAYLNGFNKLSDRVEQSNKQYIESQDVAIANAQLDSINELLEGGDYTGAYEALQARREDIKAKAEQYRITGGQSGYAPHIAIAALRQADDRWHQANLTQGWRDAEKRGEGDAYLEAARRNKPEGWTDEQHDRYVKGLLSYRNEYTAALAANQTNEFIRYATKVDTGQMTEADLLQAQAKISEKQMAELEHRIAVRDFKNGNATELYNQYQKQFGSELGMARVSGTADMDKIFNRHVEFMTAIKEHETGQPQEVSIADRAEYAKNIKATVPSLNKDIDAMMKSGNSTAAYQGAKIFSMLDSANPKAVEGIGSDAVSFAKNLLNKIEAGESIPEAHARSMEGQQKLSSKEKAERKIEFQEQLKSFADNKDESLDKLSNRKQFVLEAMGVDNPGFWGRLFGRETIHMPDGLTTEFMKTMEDFYADGKTFKDSKELAARQLGRTWRATNINGGTQIMWKAPDLFTGPDAGIEDVKLDLINQLRTQYSDGIPSLSGVRFKVVDEVEEGKPVQMNMIGSDGSVIPGQVLVVADQYTNKNDQGELANYSLQFIPEGKTVPRMLIKPDGKQFRYRLSPESLDKVRQTKEAKMKAIHEQALKNKEIEAKVFEMRENSPWESNNE